MLKVLKKNPDLSKKIENSIRLLEAEDLLVKDRELSQDTVFKHRERIDEKFLRPVKGIGTVIERSRKADFEKEVESLKAEVVKFAARVKEKLADRFRETAMQLTEELLSDVLAEIPPKWQRRLGSRPDPERLRWLNRGEENI